MQTILEKPIETKKHRGNPNWGIALPYSVVRDAIKPMRFKNLIQYREWVEENKPEGWEKWGFAPKKVVSEENNLDS
jgi:hypothetical protein